jgi:hypothetical protein
VEITMSVLTKACNIHPSIYVDNDLWTIGLRFYWTMKKFDIVKDGDLVPFMSSLFTMIKEQDEQPNAT